MSRPKFATAGVITVLILGGVVAFVMLNYQSIMDQLNAVTYQSTPEMDAIENSLELTDQGKHLFHASHPALEGQTEFNEHCDSHNTEVAVLGCYTDRNIYIYNAKQSELTGVTETTAAHELLHAVWERLSSDDKNHLGSLLNDYYNRNRDQFGDEMSLYDADQRMDELHSRIGTEGKNLPQELSDHYANYFINQANIVSFYDSYNNRFKNLKAETERLYEEITDLESTITVKTAEYKQRTETLSSNIAEFNNCANTPDCFTNQSVFNARRSELLTEQQELEQMYNEINQAIATYNNKIQEYNNSIFRTQTLQDSINSNSKPPSV